MKILDAAPSTVRPTNDWPLSARCEREITLRDEMVAAARGSFDKLSDRDLTGVVYPGAADPTA